MDISNIGSRNTQMQRSHVTPQVNVISGHKKIRNIYFCTVEKMLGLELSIIKFLKKFLLHFVKKDQQ